MNILDTVGEVLEEVSKALIGDLPYSLPLLRRLQFMNFPGGRTLHSHVLSVFHSRGIHDCLSRLLQRPRDRMLVVFILRKSSPPILLHPINLRVSNTVCTLAPLFTRRIIRHLKPIPFNNQGPPDQNPAREDTLLPSKPAKNKTRDRTSFQVHL